MDIQYVINNRYPNANWDIPPLSNPDWAAEIAYATTIADTDNAPLKNIAGYWMLQTAYEELTSETRKQLPVERSDAAQSSNVAPPAVAGMTRFVHANYDVETKQFYGILVVDSELIATGEHKPTIALAKRELQGYLALLNGGHKTLEGIKESIAAKRAEREL